MHAKKPRLQLALLLISLLLVSACATSPPSSPLPVQRAQLPPLPAEARQLPAPAWCSPSCTEAQTKRRQTWAQRSTTPEPAASAASASTTN